jgi:hypothetical protein
VEEVRRKWRVRAEEKDCGERHDAEIEEGVIAENAMENITSIRGLRSE